MEQNREKNFVCKYCSRRFPCGKSLGGHIRTHMNENSVDSDEEEAVKFLVSNNNGGVGQTSYGLRENPRKSKKIVNQSVNGKNQELSCRECGKEFHSMKALCGHMACHSEREKVVIDSESDTETSSNPSRRFKSVMKHQKEFIGDQSDSSDSYSYSYSSSESELEQEEELAITLMMLSRDCSFKKGNNNQNSVAETSDNNSVILETKSSSVNVKIKMKNQGRCENKGFKPVEESDFLASDSDDSDSGYFENGPKKVASDVTFDRFVKNSEISNPKDEFGTKPGKRIKIYKTDRAEFEKEAIREQAERASTKYDFRKSTRVMSYNPQKRSKYEIRSKEFNELVYEDGENSSRADSCAETKPGGIKIQPSYKKPISKKKNKGHECPICFRMFRSGQALGGHKRSHFMGNSTLVIKEKAMFDLNLPAVSDEN